LILSKKLPASCENRGLVIVCIRKPTFCGK
jgi:hypothetical protein